MPDTTPDPVSAYLADVRMQADDHHLVPAADVYPLLAALEAVLEMHRPGRIAVLGSLCKLHESHRYFSITSTEAAGVVACADCTAAVYESCAGCGTQMRLDRCPARAAIARELLSKESTDG